MPQVGLTNEVNPLSPPLFRDERLNDVAQLVYWVSAVLIGAALVFALIVLGLSPTRLKGVVAVSAAIWAMAIAAIVLVRSGRPVAAARVIVAGTWLISTALMVLTGGVSSPAVIGPLFSIALAGILLGDRECVGVAGLVALAAFGTAWLERTYGLDFVAPIATPWLRAGFVGAYAVAVAALQITTSRSVMNAVRAARQASEGLLMAGKIYDTTSEGIVVTAPDGSMVDVNEAFLRIHGYARADVIGQNPRMMKSGRHDADFYRRMWEVLLATGQWQGEVWDRRADGSLIAKWLSMFTVADDEGKTTHYVGVFSDITAVKEGQEALEWLATHDPLTRLPNRALLEDRLTSAVARSRRHESVTAVFFFDLDHFKDVNDLLGHAAGDRLLVALADRCSFVVRESDTIGRSGGDEFTVIASDFSGMGELSVLAGRLLSAITEPVMLGEREMHVTASLGIAVYPRDGVDAAELTRHADVAMYRAKTLGGGRMEFFSAELQDELHHKVEVETRLREALREDRLFMVYQPQVDLVSGSIVGIEALVRWRDIDGSIIMPSDFIPVAESSDLILEVGKTAWRNACADLRTLIDAGRRLTVAINVSARELMDQDVATLAMKAVKTAGLEPGDVEVEITESSIMVQIDVAAAKVRSLQDLGVKVSIDDFGTGYSSMSYVMDFHPSKLKIDRSFVSGLPHDSSAVAIVNATIALAKGIGAQVLAEGPETDEQVSFLRTHGCDIGQGFYFSQGVPLAELLTLLDEGPFSLPE